MNQASVANVEPRVPTAWLKVRHRARDQVLRADGCGPLPTGTRPEASSEIAMPPPQQF